MPRENLSHATQRGAIVVVENVVKRFGAFTALNDVNLEVGKGEKIVLCGPSGSGKSTLIRCINHIEKHDEDRIIVDGVELSNRIADINSVRCEVGMVFQSFNLFPHLTVAENCMLAPMKVRGLSQAEARDRALGLLRKVRIQDQADKYPHNCRVVSSNASRSRGRCACSPRSCCSTNRHPLSTLRWSRKC